MCGVGAEVACSTCCAVGCVVGVVLGGHYCMVGWMYTNVRNFILTFLYMQLTMQ